MQKLLQGLNFNPLGQMDKEEHESDPLCARPENWYKGPLIFFEEGEERLEKEWSDQKKAQIVAIVTLRECKVA